jgi:hypothetical protein
VGLVVFFSRKRRRTVLHYIKKIKMGKKSPNTIVTPLHLNYIRACELEKRTTLLKQITAN